MKNAFLVIDSWATIRVLFLLGSLSLAYVCVSRAETPDKTAVRPSVLSLPGGPGSIEGLGKSFQPRLNSGSFSYNIPIQVPKGTGGVAPSLELTYDSGFGNSPFGQGWHLSGSFQIERQTEKGFPRFRDSDAPGVDPGSVLPQDSFVFEGEELVPLSDGSFRLRNESAFRRFSRVAAVPGGPLDSWLVEDPNGVKHWLGRFRNDATYGDSRVVNPYPPQDPLGVRSPFEQSFAWYEDAAEDLNGNRIEFSYTRGEAASVGTLYLSEIRYFARGEAQNYHSIRFYYEDRNDILDDNRGGFNRRLASRCSEISVGSFYKGASHNLRSYVFDYDPHAGAIFLPQLGVGPPIQADNGLSRLHAVTEFGATHVPGTRYSTGTPLPATRLYYSGFFLGQAPGEFLAQLGPLSQHLRQDEDNPLALGPREHTVSQIDPLNSGQPSNILDFDLSDPKVQIADLNGDGLPDILDTNRDPTTNPSARYHVSWNVGQDQFIRGNNAAVDSTPPVDLSGSSPDIDVSLADVSGFGMVDMIQIRRNAGLGDTLVFRNKHDPGEAGSQIGFGQAEVGPGAPSGVSFSAPNARTVDLNFDKKTDVLVSTPNGLEGYLWVDRGWKSAPQRSAWTQQTGDGGIPTKYSFSYLDQGGQERPNPLVQLADMNGDRLLDLVRISVPTDGAVRISYLPMVGPMRWGKEVTLEYALTDGSASGIPGSFPMSGIEADSPEPSNLWQSVRLLDVNGDGLTDVVFVQQNKIATVYLNCAGKALLGPFKVPFQSAYQPSDDTNPTVLRVADLNGNGSSDLVFFQRVSRSLSYLDFISGQKPGLLQVVDNGVGKRSYLRYRPATVDLARARRQNVPWSTTNPNPLWVLSAIIETGGPQPAASPQARFHVTTFDYRDGYYDPFEKQFRGFAFVQQIVWGDDVPPASNTPSSVGFGSPGQRTSVSRYRFHTGAPDGVDNDEYIQGFDVGEKPTSVIDEASELAGREEEPLKGKLIWSEVADGSVLADPQGDFDLCASRVEAAINEGEAYGATASRCTPDKYVLTRTVENWAIRRLYRPPGATWPKGRLLKDEPNTVTQNRKSVSFAVRRHQSEQEVDSLDLVRLAFAPPGPALTPGSPITRGTSFDYDDFGRSTLVHEEGITAGDATRQVGGRVTKKSYILSRGQGGSIDRWIIDRLANERIENENGQFASETRYFYDGPDFIGLPAGQLGTRSLQVRVQRRIRDATAPAVALDLVPSNNQELANIRLPGNGLTGQEWLNSDRRSYDVYGNPTILLDPDGSLTQSGVPDPAIGHFRTVTYDDVFHASPTTESVYVGSNRQPLVFSASYERSESTFSAPVPLGSDVITRSSDPNGIATDYFYDAFARLTAIARPGDSETLPTIVYSYRPADPNRAVIYSYSRKGELQQSSQPAGQLANAVETNERLISGNNDTFTSIDYTDGFAHALMSLSQSAKADHFDVRNATVYGATGQPLDVFQPYEQIGVAFQVTPDSQPATSFSRDAAGRLFRTMLPAESATAGVVRPERRSYYAPLCEYRYDEEDVRASDSANSHLATPSILCNDGLGHLASVRETIKEGSGNLRAPETQYAYDLNNNLVSVLDSQHNLQWYRLDGLGRRIFRADADSGSTTYVFDDASQLIEQIDNGSYRTVLAYDGAQRPLTVTYDDHAGPSQSASGSKPPDVAYFYDDPDPNIGLGGNTVGTASFTSGRLSHIRDFSGEEHFSYDERGRIAWKLKQLRIDGNGLRSFLFKHTFDALDRLKVKVLPDNSSVAYRYDRANHLDQIVLGDGTLILKHAEYSSAGLPIRFVYGNNVVTTNEYDVRLRTVKLTSQMASSPPMLLLRYTYDGVSNVIRIEDLRPGLGTGDLRDKSQLLQYDDLYRLRSVTYPHAPSQSSPSVASKVEYRYDDIGNLVAQTSNIGPPSPTGPNLNLGLMTYGGSMGASNRQGRSGLEPGPHALTSTASGSSLQYDPSGNVIKIDGVQMSWNVAEQVTGVSSPESHTNYRYDYSGARVLKQTWKAPSGQIPSSPPDFWTAYITRDFEVSEKGNVKYIWAGDDRLAMVRSGNPASVFWYHTDPLSSTNLITNTQGAATDEDSYYPFGASRTTQRTAGLSSGSNRYHFDGKESDQESGLYYFGTRYYSSAFGRYVSADQKETYARQLANPQSLNSYAFVLNNPLSFLDPDGREAVSITLRAFIPQPTIGGFKGDNRTFSANENASSRVAVSVRIETDPAKNGGRPLIGPPKVVVQPTHLDMTGREKTSSGPQLPQVTATQDPKGNVIVNFQENMRNPFTPLGRGIRSDLNITISKDAASVLVHGTLSGSPSFEANFTTESGLTTNLPLQTAPANTLGFVLGLQQTNPIDSKTEIKQTLDPRPLP